MNNIVQIQNYTINAAEIIPLLDNYQMLPQFLRGVIIDRAIADIEYTQTEFEAAYGNLRQQYKLDTREKVQAWLDKTGSNQTQLNSRLIKKIKLDKFKQEQWGHQLKSYFLERKLALEPAIFSLIRVKSEGMVRELYQRY